MKMATYNRRKSDKRIERTPWALEIVVFLLAVSTILIISGVV